MLGFDKICIKILDKKEIFVLNLFSYRFHITSCDLKITYKYKYNYLHKGEKML